MRLLFWLSEYLASFIELFMCSIFCGAFLVKEKIGDKKYLILITTLVGSGLVLVFNNNEMFSAVNTVLILIIVYLIQLFLYKSKYVLSFLIVLLYLALLTAIDFMVAFSVALFSNIDAKNLLSEQSILRLLCIIISKLLLIFFVMIAYKTKKKELYYVKKYVLIMCLYPILIVGVFFALTEMNMYSNNRQTTILLAIFFGISIAVEILMFYQISKIGESYEQKRKTELIEMNNSMLQKSLDETQQAFGMWRRSVHDYKNKIIVLRQLAIEGDLKKIEEFLDEENKLVETKMFCIRTGNTAVDAVVNTKYQIAEEKKIVFAINASLPSHSKIREVDLANILGNLIDNAIEASEKEKEPYIDLTIKQDKSFIVIRIINKYTKELPSHLKTTKEDGVYHGVGITSVRECVDRYNGVFSLEKNGGEVVVKIMIPNY